MFKNLFNIINNLFPYKMQGKNNKIYVTYNGRKKKFEEEGCIIAGNPAKVIKRNIRWKFDSYGFVTNKYKQNSSGDKKIKYMIIKRLKHKFLKFVFRFYF